jgi:hypothetical protein
MTKKCTPLCKPITSGDIAFLGRSVGSRPNKKERLFLEERYARGK